VGLQQEKYIVHFPETRESWSYWLGLWWECTLGKKCLALRIRVDIARDEGWMAEHMLLVGVETPQARNLCGCGFFRVLRKNEFCNDDSARRLEGWKIWTIGDDIAWIRADKQGRLRAINPETGFFRRSSRYIDENQP